jgi:hypothetical protein
MSIQPRIRPCTITSSNWYQCFSSRSQLNSSPHLPTLRVGECEASAESQGAERIDRVAAATPVGELLSIEAVGIH